MNRRILSPVLLISSILLIAYAIYRSTEKRITVIENGQEVIYGQPQHGLIAGLCLIAAACILGAIALILSQKEINITEQTLMGKRTL